MTATKKAIDFTNVKDQGDFNPKHKPAGDYRMKIVKVEDSTSKAGNEQWVFTLVTATDQRSTYPYYVPQDADKAWKIRNLLVAAGFTVPKKRVSVDPNKLVGKEIGASLDDDEYNDRMKSIITQVFPADDLSEDAPEISARSSTKKRTKKAVDDEFPDDEDVDEIDLEEL